MLTGKGKRVIASAEVINHETAVHRSDIKNDLGAFAYLSYRMNELWETGARVDYTRIPFPSNSYDWGGSLWLTKYLTEQTSLRLEYQYARSPFLGSGNGIFFQILFGSGPH